jgi:hypothetical protein
VERNAQKDKRGRENAKNLEKSLTTSQKRMRKCGVALEMRRPGFIKPVGSPSGRLINPSGQALPSKHADRLRASGRVTLPSGRWCRARPDV